MNLGIHSLNPPHPYSNPAYRPDTSVLYASIRQNPDALLAMLSNDNNVDDVPDALAGVLPATMLNVCQLTHNEGTVTGVPRSSP